MSQTIVVVAFYSRTGSTEHVATLAAVGAVQARAGIRMRRLADPDPEAAIAAHADAAEHLRRMHREYVAPREADILAAHGLILGSPEGVEPGSPEWAPFFDMLARLHAEGKLLGKVGAAVGGGPQAQVFGTALGQVGFTTIPPASPDAFASMDEAASSAVALGRQVVALAEALEAPKTPA
jgi:NAD(P)H dehydrogenase (quinone)